MTTTHLRGHRVIWTHDNPVWRYEDTGEPIGDGDRPCKHCGWPPTAEGDDACLGHIPGAASACCGHGVALSFVVWEGRS